MTTTHRRPHLLTALACALLAACSGGNEVADLTTVAPAPSSTEPAAATTTEAEPSAMTTTEAVTTIPDTTVAAPDTTVAGDGLTGPMFSEALGVKVDGAPGVRTHGDTRQLLPEGLYVHIAWEPDPQDPSVFTVQPDDVEILEAYANAVTTYYRASTSDLTINNSDFAKYFVDGGALFAATFEANRDNYTESLGSGVVLRPYIPADLRSKAQATVLDCYLEDQQWVLRGATPVLGELELQGAITQLLKVDGMWRIDSIGTEPAACL